MMETFSAKRAVRNFPKHPEIQKKMQDALTSLKGIQFNDYAKASQLEQVFHGSIIELTENQKLIHLYNMLLGVGFSFYVYSSSNHPIERLEVALQEHTLMYEYLEKGDYEKFEALLRSHLKKTIELYETFV